MLKQILAFFATAALASAAAISSPYAEVFFGGSGTIPRPTLPGETSPTVASKSYASSPGEFPAWEMSATASYGLLGALAEQSGAVASGQSRSMNSFARFVDSLVVTSPGSTDTQFQWRPTIRLTGLVDWTLASGTLDPGQAASQWPVAIAVAQYVRRDGEANPTRYSHPDIFPDKGSFDQTITLDAVPVPVNEPFNYSLLLGVVSRIRNTGDLSITWSSIDFSHTLAVTGLEVLDLEGEKLQFSVQAGSGLSYTEAGINAVPEPGTFAIALAALAGLQQLRRRKGLLRRTGTCPPTHTRQAA